MGRDRGAVVVLAGWGIGKTGRPPLRCCRSRRGRCLWRGGCAERRGSGEGGGQWSVGRHGRGWGGAGPQRIARSGRKRSRRKGLGLSRWGGDIAEVLGESSLVRWLFRDGPQTVVGRFHGLDLRGIVSQGIGEVISRGGCGDGIGLVERKAF